MSIVVVISSIAAFRYELAIVLPESHEEAANLFVGCLILNCAVSGLSGLVLWAGRDLLLAGEFYSDLESWLWFAPLLIFGTGLCFACNSWCTRTREFKWYSLSQILLPVSTIALQIVMAALGIRTASGLIAGTLLGQLLSACVILALILGRYRGLLASSVTGTGIRQALIKYKAYPLYMTPYTLVGTIRDRVVYFLLAQFGGKTTLGYYNLSSRLVNVPNSLVSGAVRPVFFQHAAAVDFRHLEEPVNRALTVLAVCIVPFWVLFLLHAENIFAFLFGEPWRESALYAIVLSFPAVPLLLSNWLDRAFDALGRQRLVFALELIFSLLSIGALFAGMLIFRRPLVAIALQSAILTLYYFGWLFVLYHVAGFRTKRLLELFVIVAAVALFSVTIGWFLRSLLAFYPAVIINLVLFCGVAALFLLKQWRDLKLV